MVGLVGTQFLGLLMFYNDELETITAAGPGFWVFAKPRHILKVRLALAQVSTNTDCLAPTPQAALPLSSGGSLTQLQVGANPGTRRPQHRSGL